MSKNNNPYQRGAYKDIFAFIQNLKRAFTVSEVVEYTMTLDTELKAIVKDRNPELYADMPVGTTMKMTYSQAKASVQVVTCPRETGDAPAYGRGNFSSMGHLYFCEPLKQKEFTEDGVELRYKTIDEQEVPVHNVKGKLEPYTGKVVCEEQRYRLRYRKEAMPPWILKYAYLTLEQQIEKEAEKAEGKAKREREALEASEAKAKKAEERKAKKEAADKKAAERADKKAKSKAKKEADAAEKANRPKAKRGRKPKGAVPATEMTPEAADETADETVLEIAAETVEIEAPETEGEIVEA